MPMHCGVAFENVRSFVRGHVIRVCAFTQTNQSWMSQSTLLLNIAQITEHDIDNLWVTSLSSAVDTDRYWPRFYPVAKWVYPM